MVPQSSPAGQAVPKQGRKHAHLGPGVPAKPATPSRPSDLCLRSIPPAPAPEPAAASAAARPWAGLREEGLEDSPAGETETGLLEELLEEESRRKEASGDPAAAAPAAAASTSAAAAALATAIIIILYRELEGRTLSRNDVASGFHG